MAMNVANFNAEIRLCAPIEHFRTSRTRGIDLFSFARDFIATWSGCHRRSLAAFRQQDTPALQAFRCQFALGNGRLHGTAGLVRMGAVTKPALRRKIGNFAEQCIEPIRHVADVERANSRRVDDPATTADGMQGSRRRRMTSLGIVLADIAGFLGLARLQTG